MAKILNPTANRQLKKLRSHLNLTQAKFAEKIGITRAIVAKIEIEEINVTDRNIKAVCDAFCVNEEWIQSGLGEMSIIEDDDDELAFLFGSLLGDEDGFKKKFMIEMMKLDDMHWGDIERFIHKLTGKIKSE